VSSAGAGATTKSRWLEWGQHRKKFETRPETEPSKPAIPPPPVTAEGSGGFAGSTLGQSQNFSPEVEELHRQARATLNRRGVRFLRVGGVSSIGLWSAEDGPEVREALAVLRLDGLPVRFLDGDGIRGR
jgi:hypothetical protein